MAKVVRAACPHGDASSKPCFSEGMELVIPTEEEICQRTIAVVQRAAEDMSVYCEDYGIDFPLYIAQAYTTPAIRVAISTQTMV